MGFVKARFALQRTPSIVDARPLSAPG